MFLFLIKLYDNRDAFFLARAETGSFLQDLRLFVDFVM